MLFDDVIRNQLLIEGYKAHASVRLLALIAVWESLLISTLSGDDLSELSARDSSKRIKDFEQSWDSRSKEVFNLFIEELIALSILQAGARREIIGGSFSYAEQAITKAVKNTPSSIKGVFLGKTINEMLSTWSSRAKDVVVGTLKRGIFDDESNSALLKRIRGTASLGRKDGSLEQVRSGAVAVSNTTLQQAVSSANQVVDEAAGIGSILWLAMLEKSTCPICRSLDGKIFKINDGPRPPAHISCRCIGVPLPSGWKKIARNGMRAAQGASGIQMVPLTETYYSWLKRQPSSFIYDVLGKKRGELFVSGGISSARFSELQLDRNFQPLTLKQLRELIPRTFSRAGL